MDEIQKKKLEEKYIREGYWKGETFSSMLQKCAEAYGERAALCDGSQCISYAAWNRFADAGASYLQEQGIKSGDRVICKSPIPLHLGWHFFQSFDWCCAGTCTSGNTEKMKLHLF